MKRKIKQIKIFKNTKPQESYQFQILLDDDVHSIISCQYLSFIDAFNDCENYLIELGVI